MTAPAETDIEILFGLFVGLMLFLALWLAIQLSGGREDQERHHDEHDEGIW